LGAYTEERKAGRGGKKKGEVTHNSSERKRR